jgi:hypothetical protein
MRSYYDDRRTFPYVVVLSTQTSIDQQDWCREQFNDNVEFGWWTLYFKNEYDRNWFVLRWS